MTDSIPIVNRNDGNPTRIFISYAHKDGEKLAQLLCADLSALNFKVWLDRNRLAGGESWTKRIEAALDDADVIVALLTPGSYKSDICRAETLRALRKGKCVIPLIGIHGSDVPLHLETKHYRRYPEDFALVQSDILDRSGVPLSEQCRRTYVTAPPLPANFVPRPAALAALRDSLFAAPGGQSIALIALRGRGGIGKTILAQALCHDEVVQQAFPDGIAWVTIGKESATDLASKLREIGKGLGDDPAKYDGDLACRNEYRTLLREKAALVIVDDVWDVPSLEPFLAESGRSRLLFTTRDASIGASVGAREHTADLLSENESRKVLEKWSASAPLPAEATELVRECGGLPLALSVTGAMLRDKPTGMWRLVLARMRDAGIDKIFRALKVSVDALDDDTRRRYLTLAVLLEDMPAHPAVQQLLWNTKEGEALETAERLIDLSLAQRDGEALGLHDLQLDYVRKQSPWLSALDTIHEAVRLSSHVIARDPRQFASQLVGRLLPLQEQPVVAEFTNALRGAVPFPWIRPRNACLVPPGTALQRTLTGHTGPVSGVALSGDGRRAVSASWDQTLKVWDVETGRELLTLEGHTESVHGVAVSGDGRRAVSASWDKTLKVWDVETGLALHTLSGHAEPVKGVAMSEDGRRAVSASWDNTLKVWDIETGRELYTLGHARGVYGVALSRDGRLAVSASGDKMLKVWEIETGRELRTLEGHTDVVSGVALSDDQRRAVSASWDNTLKVWDVGTGQELLTLEGHTAHVLGVALSGDGRRAVSASDDKVVKLWDVETGRELRTFEGHTINVFGVALTRNGQRAVSASYDRTLKVWDVEAGRDPRTLGRHTNRVAQVALSRDGRRAVSASWDWTLKVWDVETGWELRTLKGHIGDVAAVALSGDGRRAVSASSDKTLKVWDVETGQELRTLKCDAYAVNEVALSEDGRRAVSSASNDKRLKVWDVEAGREERTLEDHTSRVHEVTLSGDGRRAVCASEARPPLRVWDVEVGRELRTLGNSGDSVFGMSLSRDGRRVVFASGDQTLRVWDVETGRELRTLKGHTDAINGVAVSGNGTRVVSASWDNTVRVWDFETSKSIATFTCDGAAYCCALAHDSRIAVGAEGGRVYFLDLLEPT